MEEYKKKFNDWMNKLDSQLVTVRMFHLFYFHSLAYIDKIESTIGIRKCYIALVIAVNVALAIFFSLGFKAIWL